MPRNRYYQRPDGLFETSRTINRKRVKFRGKTCAEVDRKILEFNTQQEKGRKMPVIIDEWYDIHAREISISTQRLYDRSASRLKMYFTGYSGEIKPVDVMRYIREFESKGYSKKTVTIELSVIKQIFAYAVLCGDIDVSPATEVKKSRNLPENKRHALTEEQEAKVEACRTGDWWLFGLMLLYTGCRRGELLALNWQDIDRRAGVIHINKKLNYAHNTPFLEHNLKSENGKRDIPLFKPLADALPRATRLGPIFTDEDGNYLSNTRVLNIWKKYLKDAGLEGTGITPHCFRHSFSTICFEAGIDTKSAAAFLGDTEEIMRKVYTELRSSHHTSSAEKLNAFFEMRAAEREAE